MLEHADVLLPSLTYTERTGVIQRGDRTLQLQQRVTEPPALAWSDSKILARLALKIADRLRAPDTVALNDFDPEVVHRPFTRYLGAEGEAVGELQVRFVGRCANCSYSLLSMEQIVKPALLMIPGVQRVVYRAKARAVELPSNPSPADAESILNSLLFR